MPNWLAHRKSLTKKQVDLINLPIDKNIIITGAPGSGKTLVLVYRLKRILEECKVSSDKVILFVYTKSLRDYIKTSLELLNIPDKCVNNFDSWCYQYHKNNISEEIPKIEKYPDYAGIRNNILENLINRGIQNIYDCILVDEGQDLDETCYKIFKIISRNVTVCMDDKQQIYEYQIDKPTIERILNIKSYESQNITDAWRCTPYIAKLASVYINNDEEKKYFLRQNLRPPEGRQVPYIAISTDYHKLNKKMAELIKERILKNETIAVLVPKNKIIGGVAKSLREENIEVESYKEIDFTTGKPKIMTYHGAKGLTFDSVCMPSLLKTNFGKFSSGISKRMLFVGITRAIKWIYMDYNPNSKIDFIKDIYPLNNTNDIFIDNLDDKGDNLFTNQNVSKESDLSDLI